jgi:hypothetical protein
VYRLLNRLSPFKISIFKSLWNIMSPMPY